MTQISTQISTLTLAIPVHNDRAPLLRLLARIGGLGSVAHVVVVDDGSDLPLETSELCQALETGQKTGQKTGQSTTLSLLRNDTAKGPGHARNRALTEVTTDHLLFVDADDMVTRELVPLMRDLDGRDFDFCLFQYHDTRQEKGLSWGQMPWDLSLWQDAGVALGALCPVPPGARAPLSRCANYPWNKIYRTAFLRAHAITCSEIPLHEDVELHWRSFIHARAILASDRIGVIHFVDEAGTRLTNRTGPERLEVFGPLNRIADEIAAHDPDTYALPFARFALGLIAWISDNLDPTHHTRLEELTRAFIQAHITDTIAAAITDADPGLAARMLRSELF